MAGPSIPHIDHDLLDVSNLLRTYDGSKTFPTNILGMSRELELRELDAGHWIASNHSIVLSDIVFLREAAKEIADRIKSSGPEIVLTAESKSIYLAGKVAESLGLSRFEVCRKSLKAYYKSPIATKIKSTISGEESLILDSTSQATLKGRKVAIVDDVVTTGGNMLGMEKLVKISGGAAVVKACIWVEGVPLSYDALKARENLVHLSTLPEFFDAEKLSKARAEFESVRAEYLQGP